MVPCPPIPWLTILTKESFNFAWFRLLWAKTMPSIVQIFKYFRQINITIFLMVQYWAKLELITFLQLADNSVVSYLKF